MITISTRHYTTEQLKVLEYGLSMAQDKIYERYECQYGMFCRRDCKAYAICTDINNTLYYLIRKIRERETLESISRM